MARGLVGGVSGEGLVGGVSGEGLVGGVSGEGLVGVVGWRGSALNIKLLEPLAQGASRFEKSLAPPKSTGPIFSNDVSPSKTVVDIKTLK